MNHVEGAIVLKFKYIKLNKIFADLGRIGKSQDPKSNCSDEFSSEFQFTTKDDKVIKIKKGTEISEDKLILQKSTHKEIEIDTLTIDLMKKDGQSNLKQEAIYIINGYVSNFSISENYIYFGIESDNKNLNLTITHKKQIKKDANGAVKYENIDLAVVSPNTKYTGGLGGNLNEIEIEIK